MAGHEHSHSHEHDHGVRADADRRRLAAALALIVAFMAAEVVVGIVANSLALLSDAAHMLTDAAALAMSLIVIRLKPDREAGKGPRYPLVIPIIGAATCLGFVVFQAVMLLAA